MSNFNIIIEGDRDRRTLEWLKRIRMENEIQAAAEAVAATGSKVYISNVLKKMRLSDVAKTARLDVAPPTPEQLAERQAQREAEKAAQLEQGKRNAAAVRAKLAEWEAARTAAPAAPTEAPEPTPDRPSIKERVAQMEAQARAQAQRKS